LTKTKIQPKSPSVHLLMRFSDKLGFIDNTIEAHSALIRKGGMVWFGKMGKTLGKDKVQRLNNQIEDNIPTFLYLVQRSATQGYQIYRGNILKVARDFPASQIRHIPRYYASNNIEKYIRLWIKLSSLAAIPSSEIKDFVISSTGAPVFITLGQSMAGMFTIHGE